MLYDDVSFDFVKSDFVPYKEVKIDVATVAKEQLQKLHKEIDENAHSRVLLVGEQQAVKAVNKKWFTDHGIAVKAKYIDVEVAETEEKKWCRN